jgi:repressor of nif and glnA expression
MSLELDRRLYDLLRLVDRHEPIGSIQLMELLNRYGYDIKDRTVRLHLSELDEQGLTEKVPGKGRRLTERGREELDMGDIASRLEHSRSRIASLASRVTYDPADDQGDLIASAAFVSEPDLEPTLSLISDLDALPLGPVSIDVSESTATEAGDYRILAPSSITLDGVLLTFGIDARLATANVLEYEPEAQGVPEDGTDPESAGGRIVRTVDVISGEGSTIDVLSLLIEAGRTDVSSLLDGDDRGLVVGDDREFPVDQFREARSLTHRKRERLGGTYSLQRPRERKPRSNGEFGWTFCSLVYVAAGEVLIAALAESGLATDWNTLYGIVPRHDLDRVEQFYHAGLRDGAR